MSTRRTRITAPLAIVLALALTPTLTGCFGNPIESIIEGATGGDVDLGGTSLPEGYPESEVPIIDGEILFGGSLGNDEGRVFNVTVKVADGSALDEISAQLEAAGFTTQAAGDATGGSTYIGSTDAWGVLVVVSEDGSNGWVANYTVTSAAAQ
ncbi:MAG: hypothetical protein U1E32_07465 [Rhodoglobus sp.]|jgi:hypothetical protein|nr:hypothetical protein [Rhodoglobus sp.]